MSDPLIEVPDVSALRRRSGRKWSRYPADVLPAWIADMDLLPAPAIRATLRAAAEEGDLGYGPSGRDSGVAESFAAWALRRWGWIVAPEAVMVMPDVVGGIANCIEALTRPGDAILVQTPIYPPFLSCVTRGGRRLVTSEIDVGPIDFTAIEAAIVEQRVRMLLLCHPHNPTGRCFDRGELLQLAALARKYELIVVSDEVHGDLVYPPRQHVPFATVDAAVSAVTLTSASKAFNVAGLRCAVCVVQDNALSEQLTALPAQRWTAFSTLGIRATLAAWSDSGEAWLLACVQHLQAMRDRLAERLSRDCMAIRCAPAQAGYLAWLDCTALHLDREPAAFFLERARVALSPGHEFGAPGRGHTRLNFATSAAILDEILERMCAAATA